MPYEPDFRLTVEQSAGHATILVAGEVDMATVDQLDAAVREQAPAMPVVLDLSGLSFMDSSGVRALDTLLRDAEREGWSIAFRPEFQDGVRQVLEMTGMMSVLPLQQGSER